MSQVTLLLSAQHSINGSSFCLRNFGLKSSYTGLDILITGRRSVMFSAIFLDLIFIFWQTLRSNF